MRLRMSRRCAYFCSIAGLRYNVLHHTWNDRALYTLYPSNHI
jgi:hypothetical protein